MWPKYRKQLFLVAPDALPQSDNGRHIKQKYKKKKQKEILGKNARKRNEQNHI